MKTLKDKTKCPLIKNNVILDCANCSVIDSSINCAERIINYIFKECKVELNDRFNKNIQELMRKEIIEVLEKWNVE